MENAKTKCRHNIEKGGDIKNRKTGGLKAGSQT